MLTKEIKLGREYLVYDQCYLRKATTINRTAPNKDEWLCSDGHDTPFRVNGNAFLRMVDSTRPKHVLCMSSGENLGQARMSMTGPS